MSERTQKWEITIRKCVLDLNFASTFASAFYIFFKSSKSVFPNLKQNKQHLEQHFPTEIHALVHSVITATLVDQPRYKYLWFSAILWTKGVQNTFIFMPPSGQNIVRYQILLIFRGPRGQLYVVLIPVAHLSSSESRTTWIEIMFNVVKK
jgi:hypothetical protein